ncbi:uncharacterized protein LOC123676020 [Harmonia axyridis]|uniref:uncharacterized protein LOC123676020 n=1 Tax=Harmonia axyridis TaxID=115357 RepID=UPI001E27738F|nr:uncharacterized protein LOC123676020 [Harmonia axyridis]
MGKHKNRRYKIHLSTQSKKSVLPAEPVASLPQLPVLPPELNSNVFEGIDILSLLNNAPKRVDDDTVSVKSYKSSKSLHTEDILPKKEKRKLRRQLLLRRIDTVNQFKKEHKKKQKNKQNSNDSLGLGDLVDSLPKFEYSPAPSKFKSTRETPKKKAIDKSKKIQKKTIHQVNIYKKLLKNTQLAEDPFAVLSQHLKAVVEKERMDAKESTKKSKPVK